ncbi:MAG TPA: porin, partial [Thermoguttaceae bacterium]|nr:porin [Thermoguttaceae bacterium]
LPWYDEATEGRGLLHTGIAYSYRDVADGSHRFRARPEDHLGERVLDTTIAGINDYEMLNLQAALVYGPLSIQSEYYTVATNGIGAGPSRTLDGGYIFVSYFLTGENRAYKREHGAFDRVKPFENFFRVRTEDGCVQTGRGAWEVAYRFSTLDLDSGVAGGGNVNNHTFGVNWYLTPYMRLMADLIHSDAFRDGQHGSENIFVTRAQIDW